MLTGTASVIILVGTLALLATGAYVFVALASVGIIGLLFLSDTGGRIIGAILYNSVASYTFAAIPMFLFMGEIVLQAGLGARLYRGVSQWSRVIPGGLIHSNILACAIFSAVSGSSVATAATVGTVAYPEQRATGYKDTIIIGSLAAGGALGILIPPSISMIIYGGYVGESVGRLFIGGVVPGIVMSILFMVYIAFAFVKNPSLGPPIENIRPWRYLVDAIASFKDIWPILLLIVVILGGIYGGIMTPTEAAVMSSFVVMVLAAGFRKLNYTILRKSALNALKITAMTMIIVVGAQILAQSLSMLKIPAQLSQMVAASGLSRMWVWLMIVLLYLVLGCFITGTPMMLCTLPITYPLLVHTFGFDSVWFGVALTILVEIGQITPPVGLNLFVLQGIAKGTSAQTIVTGVTPFFLVQLVVLALITFFPELVLFLPGHMMGR